MENTVRKAAVAGSFYPARPDALRAVVNECIAGADPTDVLPRAIIAPHAGYVYSGPIAGYAYRAVANRKEEIDRVILIGPSHRVPLQGVAAGSWRGFETPLGTVPVDADLVERAVSGGNVSFMDQAHIQEHALEVQLPFLQLTLGNFSIVPLVVGRADAAALGEVISLLNGSERTLIVISSDLSHYQPYADACRVDQMTSELIERLEWQAITPQRACGAYPIRGLLAYAKKAGLSAQTVALANSGDTAGSKDEVVGYGAYLFT